MGLGVGEGRIVFLSSSSFLLGERECVGDCQRKERVRMDTLAANFFCLLMSIFLSLLFFYYFFGYPLFALGGCLFLPCLVVPGSKRTRVG